MRNKLFSDIYTNVGRNVQNTSSALQTIIKEYVNQAYFDILDEVNFKAIDDDYSFSTTAGTKDYVLPSNFGKELYVYDSTNKKNIPFISLTELAEDFAAEYESQGAVDFYTIIQKQVQAQPAASSQLTIVSSSASDTTQTVHIRGISGGVEVSEDNVLTGTSDVTTTNSFTEVLAIAKSASTVGKITITAGAVTVGVIPPAIKDYKVTAMRLHLIPSSVITIKVPYLIKPTPMSSDYDTPVVDCADVIEAGATQLTWLYLRQFSKAKDWENIYEKKIRRFTWGQENTPNRVQKINFNPYSRETV